MKFSNLMFKRVVFLSVFLAFFYASAASADHLLVTRNFSGAWMQPDHESQGMVLQIAHQGEDSKVGVAHWFTFGQDLESAWFVAVGPVDGHNINMTLFAASGVGFLEPDVEGDLKVAEVGTLTLSFRNCNQGVARFDTPDDVLGAGEFRIRRLTSLFRARCSGGISDDTPSDKRPEKLGVRLLPVRDDIGGGGKAMFWERRDRSDFKVAVEGMPDGFYALKVCDEDQGELEVVAGEGSLAYRSPGIDSKLLLDFDPRHCAIELLDGLGVALSSGDAMLAPSDHPARDHDRRAMEIGVELTNTGVLPEARGRAHFRTRGNEAGFLVEIENVPAALYPLLVGGVEKGQIEVIEMDGMLQGTLKFTEPQHAESEALGFDPRGEIVEVLQGDAVILESLFPEE